MRRNRWFENGKQMVKRKTLWSSPFYFSTLTVPERQWGSGESLHVEISGAQFEFCPDWCLRPTEDKHHPPVFLLFRLKCNDLQTLKHTQITTGSQSLGWRKCICISNKFSWWFRCRWALDQAWKPADSWGSFCPLFSDSRLLALVVMFLVCFCLQRGSGAVGKARLGSQQFVTAAPALPAHGFFWTKIHNAGGERPGAVVVVV